MSPFPLALDDLAGDGGRDAEAGAIASMVRRRVNNLGHAALAECPSPAASPYPRPAVIGSAISSRIVPLARRSQRFPSGYSVGPECHSRHTSVLYRKYV